MSTKKIMSAPKRFRNRPVEIEAWQLPCIDDPDLSMTEYVDTCIAIAEWCDGTSHMMLEDEEWPRWAIVKGKHIVLHTPVGFGVARPGDWIIRNPKGEFYPRNPELFEENYEPL